ACDGRGEEAQLAGFRLRNRYRESQKSAAAFKHAQGARPDALAHGVENYIVAGNLVFNFVTGVIDPKIGTELTQKVLVARASRRRDIGSQGLGNLHGEHADSARSRMDHDALAGLTLS